MGRFASHLKLVSEQTQPCTFTSLDHVFVDYARLAALATQCAAADDGGAFRDAWAEELGRATARFDEHYESLSGIYLDAVLDGSDGDVVAFTASDIRAKLEALVKSKGRDFALDLFSGDRVLLQTASLNAEALHLGLKKYDKRAAAAAKESERAAPGAAMMRALLPKLYASTTYHATGARSLSGELQAFRELLDEDEGDWAAAAEEKKEEGPAVIDRNKVEELKGEEYKWFMEQAKGLSEKELASLVSHRGFHSETDDSVARPIENSLSSFEYCWGAGVHLAECDVGATKDEKIIMAHDEDFARLSLLSNENSATVVKDLTLSEIMRLPLKHGSRPPLLVDVLRSAMAIGEHAKLVIEVKSGNSEIVEPLMMLFKRHPALLSRVAVIMSFDLYIMQDIADRFALTNAGMIGGPGLGVIGEGAPGVSPLPGASARTSRRLRKTMARPMQSVSYGAVNAGGGGPPPVPKLLLLTSHVDYGKVYNVTSVKEDFEGLSHKVPVDNGIDGVYLEYEPEMLEPEGRERMLKLAESYTVGVWMLKPRDPDSLSICRRLVDECGVSYVNTDFHRGFFST